MAPPRLRRIAHNRCGAELEPASVPMATERRGTIFNHVSSENADTRPTRAAPVVGDLAGREDAGKRAPAAPRGQH